MLYHPSGLLARRRLNDGQCHQVAIAVAKVPIHDRNATWGKDDAGGTRLLGVPLLLLLLLLVSLLSSFWCVKDLNAFRRCVTLKSARCNLTSHKRRIELMDYLFKIESTEVKKQPGRPIDLSLG